MGPFLLNEATLVYTVRLCEDTLWSSPLQKDVRGLTQQALKFMTFVCVCVCAIYPILNVPPRPPYLFRPGIGNETCTLSRANF